MGYFPKKKKKIPQSYPNPLARVSSRETAMAARSIGLLTFVRKASHAFTVTPSLDKNRKLSYHWTLSSPLLSSGANSLPNSK